MDNSDLLPLLFPHPAATFNTRGGAEVNGLPQNTVPQNCEIVCSGVDTGKFTKRQVHYCVRLNGATVRLRVCDASPDSGYAEFAVVLDVARSTEAGAQLEGYARESIAAICGDVIEGRAPDL